MGAAGGHHQLPRGEGVTARCRSSVQPPRQSLLPVNLLTPPPGHSGGDGNGNGDVVPTLSAPSGP
jgi:hypothetical protein